MKPVPEIPGSPLVTGPTWSNMGNMLVKENISGIGGGSGSSSSSSSSKA